MKKLLLGLGMLSLVALPVVALVSCSSETQKTVMKGSLKNGVTSANIKITIAAIKAYEKSQKAEGDKNILIAALNTTSFSGLLVTDLPNYKITYTETDGSETITLTANSGFTFELGTKLISKAKDADVEMKGSLNQGTVTSVNITTTIVAIKVYEGKTTPTTSDKDNLITALNKTSFTGLLATDIPNYVISYIETSGSETITLTANSGFTFELGTKLISKAKAADVELKGSLNQGAVTANDIEITILDIKIYEAISTPTDSDKDNLITALTFKSFTGLLATDIPNYKITYTETDGKEAITLTANSGFTFESGTELVSTIEVVMPGAINSGGATNTEMKTTIVAIKVYEGKITPTTSDKDNLITALNKTSFTGLLAADIPNFVITYTETPGSETITLTPNEGFRFSTGTPLISTQLVQFTGDILNKSDLMDIGFDKKTTITLEDWKKWAPNVKQLGTQINETETSSTAPFYQNTTLKSIVIPNTIEIIGTQAFRDTSLHSITFEKNSNLKTISTNAFKTCNISDNFTLPDSVTHLYKEAFSGVNLNENQFIINSTSSLTNLGKEVFWNALNISNMIYIPDTVTTLDGASFNGTTLLTNGFSISGKLRTSVTATYGFNQDQWDSITWRLVKFMGEILNKSDVLSMLWDKKTTITLEDWKKWAPNVKQLGTQINDAGTSSTAPFHQNTTLKSIVIPKTIEIIGTWAFGNTVLDYITFEPGSILKTISTNAFKESSIDNNFTLPDSVTHLYKEAFSRLNLNGNEFIINPSSTLQSLDKEVFWNALNISNMIYIPDTVTTIGTATFNSTTNLTSGFSISDKFRTSASAMYGFNQAQWDNNITWR